MSALPDVVLEPASARDSALLANLLELYIHDLSEAFEIEIGDDGRFGYPPLALYWTEPDRRFAFLAKAGGRLVGFALVTLGSRMSDDPNVHDVAEFFILRRYRRLGIGKEAAALMWSRFPGRWIVRAAARNIAAVSFWRKVIADYTAGAFTEVQRDSDGRVWNVFAFETQ